MIVIWNGKVWMPEKSGNDGEVKVVAAVAKAAFRLNKSEYTFKWNTIWIISIKYTVLSRHEWTPVSSCLSTVESANRLRKKTNIHEMWRTEKNKQPSIKQHWIQLRCQNSQQQIINHMRIELNFEYRTCT